MVTLVGIEPNMTRVKISYPEPLDDRAIGVWCFLKKPLGENFPFIKGGAVCGTRTHGDILLGRQTQSPLCEYRLCNNKN